MFASEMLKESAFSFALETRRVRQILARVRSALPSETNPKKARVYRVPRRRSPELKLLQGGLAGDAA
jgi:hypothetical protein